MVGILRLIGGFVIAAAFIVGWIAFAWLIMLVTLYVVRAIPLTGRRRTVVGQGTQKVDKGQADRLR